ncbi:MAG: NERD domain-containing protein [Muribaculaceae bacterium]|nr:NERD domain-containing protein [Muribaculaceae bacterium]
MSDGSFEMDLKILCGILAVIALMLVALIVIMRWRAGRGRRKGRRGEQIVAKALCKLKRRDAIVLNDVLLPVAKGRTSQIDHIVISTRGIFVIETKSLSGKISGSEHSQYWTQHLYSQTRQIYNPLLQNKGHIRALSRMFPNLDADLFISIVVFTEAQELDITADDIVEQRSLLPDRRVRRTFIRSESRKRKWWRRGKEIRLDERNVITGVEGIVKEIERRDRVLRRAELPKIAAAIQKVALHSWGAAREHTAYARQTSRKILHEIQQGICPRCGGKLVKKKGTNGEFVACENYPSCRFTCSTDQLH